jgi:DNA ligase-associated metallophosphoesterase
MTAAQNTSPDRGPASAALWQAWAGETVALLPERALWWPREHTLFVADVHLGKAAGFRAQGVPVPAGTTQDNLERLSALLRQYPAQRLVVLGDWLHAASGRTPAVLAAWRQWRQRHTALAHVLVRGNHDAHAGDPPADLGLQTVAEPWHLGPFACCHHPQTLPGRFVLAGHVHPVCRLRGPGRDVLRLPCFAQYADGALLPAFGAFTGGHLIMPPASGALYPIGGGRVWRLDAGYPLPAPPG